MNNQLLFLNRDSFGDPMNLGKTMSEEEAMLLLDEWVKNEKLKVHMKQVAHLMRAFSDSKKYVQESVHKCYLAGLLNDADWDQWPDHHCKNIIEELVR